MIQTVDLLVFRVGDQRYAAEASQVRRIAKAGAYSRLSDALGMPEEGTRALVFDLAASSEPEHHGPTEQELCIDAVEGLRAARVDALRRLPLAAGQVEAVLGLWLEDDGRPVVLVDLSRALSHPSSYGGSV